MNRDQLVVAAEGAIRQGSQSFRAASRLFDRQTRERSWLLYCWCRHCDDACDGQTFGQGRAERVPVAQLREKTRKAIAGEATGEIPYDALRQLVEECAIPARLVEDHLEGFALDEAGWHPQREEDLIRYCYHVAGAVGCMMAILMGVSPDEDETLERAADLGIAFQLSNIARDVRDDLANGRCYLPADWLAEYGVDRETLFDPGNSPALVAMMERLLEQVETYEQSARRGVARLPFRSRLAVLTAMRIYGAIGRSVGRLGPHAWDQRVAIGKARKLVMLVPSLAEAMRPHRG